MIDSMVADAAANVKAVRRLDRGLAA